MRDDRGERDDASLVAAIPGGDLGALRELYARHAPWLSARLTRRCSDTDVVADVLQDCCVPGVPLDTGGARCDG